MSGQVDIQTNKLTAAEWAAIIVATTKFQQSLEPIAPVLTQGRRRVTKTMVKNGDMFDMYQRILTKLRMKFKIQDEEEKHQKVLNGFEEVGEIITFRRPEDAVKWKGLVQPTGD